MKKSGCSRVSPLQKKRGDDVRDGMDERVNLRVGSIQTFLARMLRQKFLIK